MLRLIEGSEAITEAAVAAGCRFFAGYPMTPFTEVLEHMARKLPEVGGTCINAESDPQPGVCRIGQCPAKSPIVVPPSGPQQQHLEGSRVIAP